MHRILSCLLSAGALSAIIYQNHRLFSTNKTENGMKLKVVSIGKQKDVYK